MRKPDILIIAPEDNEEAKSVLDYLQKQNQKFDIFFLNIELFPQKKSCIFDFNNDNFSVNFISFFL